MSYKVRLQSFEGPFDLLVYLIENARMSIYDIQVSQITAQYLEYVRHLKKLDYAGAAEFMVLAATLLDIKSRMMLPRPSIAGTVLPEEDPRSELVEKILEYKKFKACAERLEERQDANALIFEKPQEDISEYLDHPDEYLTLDAAKFAAAFELFLSKKKREEEVRAHYVRVEREKATMESRMAYINERLVRAGRRGTTHLTLGDLIPDASDPYDIVVTFVSVLQMMREDLVDAQQRSNYGEIYVSMKGKNA